MNKDNNYYNWIESTLMNDENSTDEEMKDYFITEGQITKKEATFYINQRQTALLDWQKFKLTKYKEDWLKWN